MSGVIDKRVHHHDPGGSVEARAALFVPRPHRSSTTPSTQEKAGITMSRGIVSNDPGPRFGGDDLGAIMRGDAGKQMEASFKEFCDRPENRPLMERHQAKEVKKVIDRGRP